MTTDKLAEEILDNTTYGSMYEIMEREELIQAMQSYAKLYHEEKMKEELMMKEELITFMEFLTIDKYTDNPDIDIIDEYLKQRNNENKKMD